MTGSDPRLERVLTVVNGKGGVGKTSITTNVAGCVALAGRRVLVVDLDISGNARADLGVAEEAGAENGRSTLDAIWNGKTLQPLTDVRRGLDLLPGGKNLEMLEDLHYAQGPNLDGGSVPSAFAARLAELADAYDLVLIDGPPGNPLLQRIALQSARHILVPTKTDAASWDGLRMIGPRVREVRNGTSTHPSSPLLSYLGVVIFDHTTGATRILREARATLAEELGDKVPVLDTFIRHSQAASTQCRTYGQLAHELAADYPGTEVDRVSQSARPLAEDYAALTREILQRIYEPATADAAPDAPINLQAAQSPVRA